MKHSATYTLLLLLLVAILLAIPGCVVLRFDGSKSCEEMARLMQCHMIPNCALTPREADALLRQTHECHYYQEHGRAR